MKTMCKDFIKCGMIGWCMEILFTAFDSFRRHDFRLLGVTSLWMFPIYGLAFIIRPIAHLLRRKSFFHRGIIYMTGIFIIEFITGEFLMKRRMCPWNYHFSNWQIKDIIRLDFAPLWFLAGLFFEALLVPHTKMRKGKKKPDMIHPH